MRDEERKQSGLSIFLFIHPSSLPPSSLRRPVIYGTLNEAICFPFRVV
ncbi:MAG TPA: hypothetical protein VF779_13470 [Pyrinomonadaceae bacterium]